MGEVGSFLTLRDTLLKHRQLIYFNYYNLRLNAQLTLINCAWLIRRPLSPAPFPTHYPQEEGEVVEGQHEDEQWIPSVHNFAQSSISFEENR
jgi:hypothetical protein